MATWVSRIAEELSPKDVKLFRQDLQDKIGKLKSLVDRSDYYKAQFKEAEQMLDAFDYYLLETHLLG